MGNRVEKAIKLFESGYNCAQSVFTAYADFYGVDKDLALKLSSSFGRGVADMNEICGAICGMSMIVGLEIGAIVAQDSGKREANYRMVQRLADDFRKNHGSIICKQLLEENQEIVSGIKRKPCVEYVKYCAELIEKNIINTIFK